MDVVLVVKRACIILIVTLTTLLQLTMSDDMLQQNNLYCTLAVECLFSNLICLLTS